MTIPLLLRVRTQGTQWLVWNFQSESTLADALLGNFPACLDEYMNGGRGTMKDTDKRDSQVRVRV